MNRMRRKKIIWEFTKNDVIRLAINEEGLILGGGNSYNLRLRVVPKDIGVVTKDELGLDKIKKWFEYKKEKERGDNGGNT